VVRPTLVVIVAAVVVVFLFFFVLLKASSRHTSDGPKLSAAKLLLSSAPGQSSVFARKTEKTVRPHGYGGPTDSIDANVEKKNHNTEQPLVHTATSTRAVLRDT
jgi:hypothetical protein